MTGHRVTLIALLSSAVLATGARAEGEAESFTLAPRKSRVAESTPTSEPAAATQPGDMTLNIPAATEPLPEAQLASVPTYTPLGFAGKSSFALSGGSYDFVPIPDRWRIGIPGNYVQNVQGRAIDPYNQNVLKGDYAIIGQDKFLSITVTSDTLLETRRVPVPSGVSSLRTGSFKFFGDGEQYFANQNVILSVSLFQGDAGYKPRDWEARVTPVFNWNYLQVEELGLTNPDVRKGTSRDDNWVGFQEAFFEYRLSYQTVNYDFTSVRSGIQGFTSDFRGFLFSDSEPGVRIFGNWDNNRIQYNLAWFHALEKDTNSGLNSYTLRDQDVFIANVFIQDSLLYFSPRSTNPLLYGYTTQFSFHANIDNGNGEGIQLDENGVIVRPAPIGAIDEKDVRAYYLGWAGDGHFGRLNITHQFYWAFGQETFNPLAGESVDINAQFFAIELSYDQDWLRYRASFAYASGDDDPEDGTATGFDSIFDNPNFAGGGFSYLTRQAVRLTGTGVNLVNRFSFLPDLRTSKEQGQANFVNPGLLLYNVGLDAELTPKLKAVFNVSYIQFENTETLKVLLHDDKISRDFGIDYSLGIIYRPFLNNNAIFTAGVAVLQPLQGFEDIYNSETEYSFFLGMTFTY